jgi:hypothetical protein
MNRRIVDLTDSSCLSFCKEMGFKFLTQETSSSRVDGRSKNHYSMRFFKVDRFIEFLAEDDYL